MGCDIHAFIEYAYDGDTYTNTFCDSEIHIGRDYDLFGLIAGVRGTTSPLILPRGFPSACIAAGNTTIFAQNWHVQEKYDEYGKDAHSATWLTLDELKQIRVEYIKDKLEFNGVFDKKIWSLTNDPNIMNSIFTYTFGDNENSGLYLSIVIMESLLKLDPTIKTRFVCWFDS